MFSILKGGLILVAGGEHALRPAGRATASRWRTWLGIPSPVWIMVVLTVVAFLWMRYSRTGRSQYAVGGNAEAARLSGLDTRRILDDHVHPERAVRRAWRASCSRPSSTRSRPWRTPGLELQVITASVVGGVSILGGVGTVIGSTLAAILDPLHRLGAGVRQHLAVLGEGDPRRAHPRDGARRRRCVAAGRNASR